MSSRPIESSAPVRPATTTTTTTTTTGETPSRLPGLPPVDVNEYGGRKGDERQSMNERLFMQLLVFRITDRERFCEQLAQRFGASNIPVVVYADAGHPQSFGLLTWSRDPSHFVTTVAPVLNQFDLLVLRDEYTMTGRTYAIGHEPDLAFVLLERPVKNVTDPEFPWHVWYPLKRYGKFNTLDAQEQGAMMREHAAIGFAYGQAGLAHDVRLACHGIDAHDNEFVIGLVGRELHPLSHLVQAMRKTRQTSEFIEKMGPFFVGRVLYRTG